MNINDIHGKKLSELFEYPVYRNGGSSLVNLHNSQIKELLEQRDDIYFEVLTGNMIGCIFKATFDWTHILIDLTIYKPKLYRSESFSYIPYLKDDYRVLIKGVDPSVDVKYLKKKDRPTEKSAELFDHFGQLLEVGQMVIYPCGKSGNLNTAFGNISRISHKGTIFLRRIKTKDGYGMEKEDKLSPTVPPDRLIILDGDLLDKVIIAKLST